MPGRVVAGIRLYRAFQRRQVLVVGNLLAGKDALARVSPRPGFTKLINIFTMNKTWRLVDLPGYGFAQVARENRTRFNRAVTNYLQHRPNLCCVFALLDSGLSPREIDLDFVEWLARKGVPFVLVFTKTDRAAPETVAANIAAFTEAIAGWFEQLPEVFQCSATTGQGRSELLGIASATLAAGGISPPATTPASSLEVEPPFSLRVRAGGVAIALRTKKQRKATDPGEVDAGPVFNLTEMAKVSTGPGRSGWSCRPRSYR